MDKLYKVNYIDHITKLERSRNVRAKNKREVRKKWSVMYYAPYPITSIEELKEV